METATKERLTGALLVVLALVTVIPELLSGRDSTTQGTPPAQDPEEGAPLQTYDVQLDGSSATPAMPRDVPAAAAAEIAAVPPPVTSTEPPTVPASASPVASPTAPPLAQVAADATPTVKPPVNQAPAAPSAAKPQQARDPSAASAAKEPAASPVKEPPPTDAGKWWVQLGSFASRDNAQQLARKLHAAGFNIDVSQSHSKGKELFRVRAGPVADHDAASALQARLAAAGEKNSSVVAP